MEYLRPKEKIEIITLIDFLDENNHEFSQLKLFYKLSDFEAISLMLKYYGTSYLMPSNEFTDTALTEAIEKSNKNY